MFHSQFASVFPSVGSINDDLSRFPYFPPQRHAITKLRDKLKYRTEKQVDDAVQRLETQIHTHNFKLREEEKIVREINELKKSKRTIRDYDSKKVRHSPLQWPSANDGA